MTIYRDGRLSPERTRELLEKIVYADSENEAERWIFRAQEEIANEPGIPAGHVLMNGRLVKV